MPADACVAPPATGRGSITVQRTPRTASSRAIAQPMIPAPTTRVVRRSVTDVLEERAAHAELLIIHEKEVSARSAPSVSTSVTGVPAGLLLEPRDGRFELADAAVGAVPLHEDR